MAAPDPIFDLMPPGDGHVFAVADGARVDGLPEWLAQQGIARRALYLDLKRGGAGNAAGPWLVPCPDDSIIADLRAGLPAEAVVWWLWPAESFEAARAAIYHHLRGLGMAEIPVAPPGRTERTGPGVEQVLFRHADPAAMRALLPILDPRQRARVWGGAKAIVVDLGPAGGGLRRATAPPDMPPRAPGLLRLTPEQMAALDAWQAQTRDAVMVDYLRSNATHAVAGQDDAALAALARAADRRAAQLGLSDGSPRLLFAWIVAMTDGQALTAPQIENALTRSGGHPDDALSSLLAGLC